MPKKMSGTNGRKKCPVLLLETIDKQKQKKTVEIRVWNTLHFRRFCRFENVDVLIGGLYEIPCSLHRDLDIHNIGDNFFEKMESGFLNIVVAKSCCSLPHWNEFGRGAGHEYIDFKVVVSSMSTGTVGSALWVSSAILIWLILPTRYVRYVLWVDDGEWQWRHTMLVP